MNFTELENSILKELDNCIIGMRIAKKIVQEKIEIAKNRNDERE